MKSKQRFTVLLIIGIFWLIIGVVLNVVLTKDCSKGEAFLSGFSLSFGGTLIILSVIMLLSKNSLKECDCVQTDERLKSLNYRAGYTAFLIGTMAESISCVILGFLGLIEAIIALSAVILLQCLVYWISYYVLRRKC